MQETDQDTCPICKAQREHITCQHYDRMAALHEGYARRVIQLAQEYEESVMRQAEWRQEQFRIIENLHAEHVGDDDA